MPCPQSKSAGVCLLKGLGAQRSPEPLCPHSSSTSEEPGEEALCPCPWGSVSSVRGEAELGHPTSSPVKMVDGPMTSSADLLNSDPFRVYLSMAPKLKDFHRYLRIIISM